MKSKITGINFEAGKPIKCVKATLYATNRYFKIINMTDSETFPYDIMLQLKSIDKRYKGNNLYPTFYAYRFEKAGQEYIILKLKGIVE